MQVEVINNAGADEQLVKQLIQAVSFAAGQETGREDFEVSLTVTGDDEIRAVNKQYRDVDAVTDVLSFPLIEFEGYSDQEPEEQGQADGDQFDDCERDPETGLIMLGDIVLNTTRAAQQAQEYGHSMQREACYLCVHSVLHLLGYDHMTDGDKAIMRAREEEIMNGLGLAR